MKTSTKAAAAALGLWLAAAFAIPIGAAAPRDVSASTPVEVRLDYLEKLLLSRSGERIREHQPDVANETGRLLADARAAVAAGERERAAGLAKEGLAALMRATSALPQDQEELNRHKKRYEKLRQGLSKFTSAESDNKERFGVDAAEQRYDRERITKLIEEAENEAVNDRYAKAAELLEEAQGLVTASLQGLLNHKQLVIELDIGTPEKEYVYELRRYMGYEELIPVALEVRKPEAMVAEEMIRLGEKAKWMSEQARAKAIEQNYPYAIRMMMDATDVVRQALRMAGIMM